MAFFQIDKNPKKKFFDKETDRTSLTREDYEDAWKALYENAKEYHLFLLKASNGDMNRIIEVLNPFLSNCGLVCELLLKAILCFEQTDYMVHLRGKDRHSLYQLYGLLNSNTKEEIMNQFPHRSDKRENFELCLQENAQILYELRYATEYKELAGDTCFIPDLMVTLHIVMAKNK